MYIRRLDFLGIFCFIGIFIYAANGGLQLEGSAEDDLEGSDTPKVKMSNVSTAEGQGSSLVCVADGYPQTYTFYRFKHYWNGSLIRTLQGVQKKNEVTVGFPFTVLEDSGSYECVVENGIPGKNGATNETTTGSLSVRATPRLSGDTVILRQLGMSASLEVSVISIPSYSSVLWSHNGSAIENGTKRELSSFEKQIPFNIYGATVSVSGQLIRLVIASIVQTDIGNYRLMVCNDIGCASSTHELKLGIGQQYQEEQPGFGAGIGVGVVTAAAVCVVVVVVLRWRLWTYFRCTKCLRKSGNHLPDVSQSKNAVGSDQCTSKETGQASTGTEQQEKREGVSIACPPENEYETLQSDRSGQVYEKISVDVNTDVGADYTNARIM